MRCNVFNVADLSLNNESRNEEFLLLQRDLVGITEEDEAMINNLQHQLTKRNERCTELEDEVRGVYYH